MKIQSEAGRSMCIWDQAGLQEVVQEQAQKQYRKILLKKKQINKKKMKSVGTIVVFIISIRKYEPFIYLIW